jgi:hypothetical protein
MTTRSNFTILSPFNVALICPRHSRGRRPGLEPQFWCAARSSSFRDSFGRVCYPMRTREREWNNPNTLRSHSTTQITTTAFKIDLMLPAMGMN